MSKTVETGKNAKPKTVETTEKTRHVDLVELMGMDYARFSRLLPYRYVDTAARLFINHHSLGFACELAPLVSAVLLRSSLLTLNRSQTSVTSWAD